VAPELYALLENERRQTLSGSAAVGLLPLRRVDPDEAEALTLLQVGVAGMVLGCLCLLMALLEHLGGSRKLV
jgi:hypothetical protein